ncbi:MAG: hypothetical protein NXI32_30995, partial [bacterium]|nr:hypothetical protein [bacterium]
LRCENPEKIGELIHRGFEALQSHPVAKAQQLRLVECPQVPDFEQVSSVLGTAFGLTPTFGFADGWLLIGSNGQAIQRVLAVRSGEAKSIVESEPFLALAPLIEDPVYAVSYNNLGESIRNGAKMLGQVGAVAQIAIGIAGMQPDAAELKPVQDFMALMPDVAKIVAKFDFLEEQLSVSQALSDEPGAYTRSTVIKVRSPSKPEPAAETTPASE